MALTLVFVDESIHIRKLMCVPISSSLLERKHGKKLGDVAAEVDRKRGHEKTSDGHSTGPTFESPDLAWGDISNARAPLEHDRLIDNYSDIFL